MTDTMMIRSSAVMQVSDVLRARDFYCQKLGFESVGLWGEPPCFCIVGRGTVTVFLDQSREPAKTPLNQYWAAYIYVADVDALCQEYRAKGIEIVRGPADADYGCREIDVRDPDGHIIGFGQDLTPSAAGPGL